MRFVLLLATVAFGVTLGHANASTINLSTGQDGSGNIQSGGGSADANWNLVAPADHEFRPPHGVVVASNDQDWNSGWVANNATSSWIAGDPFSTDNGTFTAAVSFDMSGFDLSTASLSGFWTLDDQGTISLNGNLLATLGNGTWGALSAVSATAADFVSGINILTIQITSSNDYQEGVRFDGGVTASPAVPEPMTLSIMGAGLAGLAAVRRRTRLKGYAAA